MVHRAACGVNDALFLATKIRADAVHAVFGKQSLEMMRNGQKTEMTTSGNAVEYQNTCAP